MQFRRRSFALLAVSTVAVTASSCSGDDAGGDALRVYSGRHYGIEQAFEQFTAATGIEVQFLTGKDGELRERIAAEGEDTEADAFITVDAGNLAAATAQGLFQPVESTALTTAIPAELRDPEGHWFGLTVRARTIVHSTERVSPDDAPATYEELAEPQWKGKICLRNSSNVYQQSLVASLIAEHGEAEALRIVKGWAANAQILANDDLILESIADGLCDVGITNHYYLAKKYEENPQFPVAALWANQDDRGVHVNISGGGVTKWSDRPAEAQRLLEWLATDGQAVLVSGNHEIPGNPDVAPDALFTDRFGTDVVRDPLDAATIGSTNAAAVRLLDEAGYE
ncbi:MAG: extracellular solute-binding protein [Ilumatobacteraceae bacterium]